MHLIEAYNNNNLHSLHKKYKTHLHIIIRGNDTHSYQNSLKK